MGQSLQSISEMYQALRPLWLRDLGLLGVGVSAANGSAAGGMDVHALSGPWHTGQLTESQAPWAATKNEWATALANHAALPDVHHAAATAGTLISLAGQQVSLAAGTAQYQVPVTGATPFAPAWTTLAGFAGNGLAFTGGQFAVGVANTGAAGLSVEADLVRLTSSSNPGAAASILASSGSGALTLVSLGATLSVRTPLIDANASMTIRPLNGDLVLEPSSNLVKLSSGRALQSDNYASQTTGMRVSAAGEGDFRYLFVDEMHAKSFIADLEQALAGGQIISKSVAVLAATFVAPVAGGTATLIVRDLPSAPNMACFVAGDIVRLRQFSRAGGSLSISDCWGTVTGYSDNPDRTQTWTFTRSAAPNAGAMSAGATVAADAIVLDYGTTGNGIYEVNAIDGAYALNSPYAQIVSWATHPATGQTVRARLGNLRGIFGTANEYGLYAGAGVTTSDAYLRVSNTEVGLYNVPLRLYTGSTERVRIAAHNDVWIGPSTTDRRLEWNGSVLTVRGAIVIQAGSSGIGSFSDAGALATQSSVTWSTQVTGTGKPADNATVGATWETNVFSRPTELTDGRITTAISSGGVVQSRVDPGVAWGANPGAGVAGLLLGSDYMGYWTGSNWRSYMDNTGKFYLNAGASSNFLSWNGSVLTVNGAVTVTGGNANITVGDGVKDSTLNGWNIGATEVVGQANGIDQVVMNANGHLLAGSNTVRLSNAGVEIVRGAGSAVNRLLFVSAFGGEQTARITCYTDSSAILPYFDYNVLTLEPLTSTGKTKTLTWIKSDVVAVGIEANSINVDTVGYDWSALTPDAGWANFDTVNYPSFGVKRFGNMVSIKGVIKATVAKSGYAQLYQLAAAYRPTRRRLFTCWSSAGITRVDVAADGRIYIELAIPLNGTVSLEIMYFTGG